MTPDPYDQLEADLESVWVLWSYEQWRNWMAEIADSVRSAAAYARLQMALDLLERGSRENR